MIKMGVLATWIDTTEVSGAGQPIDIVLNNVLIGKLFYKWRSSSSGTVRFENFVIHQLKTMFVMRSA